MRVVAVHCYNGGFAEGCRRAGAHIEAIWETDQPARKFQQESLACLRLNFPNTPILHGVGNWGNAAYAPDLMVANPPCSLWSRLGTKDNQGRKTLRDPTSRYACVREVNTARWGLNPKVFAMESLLTFEGTELFNETVNGLLTDGYEVHLVRHDCKFLGLPQQRRRLMVVGSRVQLAWTCPYSRMVTLREVFAKIADPGFSKPVRPQWLILWALAGRRSFRKVMKSSAVLEKIRPIPAMVKKRVDLDSIMWTITKPLYAYLPDVPRTIGLNEASAIMGFGPEWKWTVPENEKRRTTEEVLTWMCRGVTPAAGEWVASVIAPQLAGPPARPGHVQVWDFTAPTGRREDWRRAS